MNEQFYTARQIGNRQIQVQLGLSRFMRLIDSASGPNNLSGLVDLYAALDLKESLGVEIGCWTGESAEIAAQFLEHLWCVDPWEPEDNREQLFDQRMARFKNTTKLRMTSAAASALFCSQSIHLVYIDGQHDYYNVSKDIRLWFPKLVMGGWIAGHDYDELEEHAGVRQSVNNLLGSPDLTFSDGSWVFRKTERLVSNFQIGERLESCR